jgi:hypothetical protein
MTYTSSIKCSMVIQFFDFNIGFKKMNIKIIPTFEDISKMSTRKK